MGERLERGGDFARQAQNDKHVPDPKSSMEVGTEFFIATETYGGREHRHKSVVCIRSSYSKTVLIVVFDLQVRNCTLNVEH